MNQKLPKNIWLNGICDYIHEESEKAKSHCGRHHDDGTALGWSCVREDKHDGMCHAHTGHGECFAQWDSQKVGPDKSKQKGRVKKMEHPDDMFKMLFERITGHEVESKKGREVGKLSPEELASLELHNSKVKQLLQEKERIIEELQMSEIERRRWWRKVEKNHNAVGNSLTIEDGVLYEIDKEN